MNIALGIYFFRVLVADRNLFAISMLSYFGRLVSLVFFQVGRSIMEMPLQSLYLTAICWKIVRRWDQQCQPKRIFLYFISGEQLLRQLRENFAVVLCEDCSGIACSSTAVRSIIFAVFNTIFLGRNQILRKVLTAYKQFIQTKNNLIFHILIFHIFHMQCALCMYVFICTSL